MMRFDCTTSLNPFILLYLIFTLTAFVISPLPEHSLPYLIQAGGGAAGFLVVYAWLNRPARLRGLLQGLVWAGGALALAGLFLVEWPAQYLFDLRPLLNQLPRLSTSFSIHPNAMAGAILPPLCLAGGVRQLKLSRGQRLLLLVSVALMGLMLLLTQSRNAWLALLVAWAAYRLWGRFHFAFLALGLGLLITLPFAVTLLPEAGLATLERSVTAADTLTKSGGVEDPSWLSRLEIWRVAGQTVADYSVLGTGLYTFEPVSRANYVYTVVSPRLELAHAHNLFLQTAVNLGLMGVLTLLALWGLVLWGLWQRRPQFEPGGDGVEWTAVLGAALVGYLWFNLFDLIAWEMRAGVFIWLYLATALRLSPARPQLSAKWVGTVLAVWFIVLFSPLGRQNWQHLRLDQARFAQTGALTISPTAFTNDARRLGLAYFLQQEAETAVVTWQADGQSVPFLRQQGMVAYLDGAWETAVVWYNLALQVDDTDGLTHYWLGLVYHFEGDPDQARRHYDLALAALIEGGPPTVVAEIWEARGRVLAQMTEWQASADSFAQAVALFPDNPDYRQQLEQVSQLLPGGE
jgi:putative inorganic carbon (hco3(-)) transporter